MTARVVIAVSALIVDSVGIVGIAQLVAEVATVGLAVIADLAEVV